MFVDEAKRGDYLIAAVAISPRDLAHTRRVMRQLLLGNQRRIHFKDERAARKQQIIGAVIGLGLTARLYVNSARIAELEARKACIRTNWFPISQTSEPLDS